MPTVLIVDDVAAMAEQYAFDLRRVGDFKTVVAGGGQEALDILKAQNIDCIILDLEMPGMDGFEVLEILQRDGYDAPVIVYTGAGSYDRCIRAIQMGAYSFIDKEEAIVRVVNVVNNALEHDRVKDELSVVKRRLPGPSGLIGSSSQMDELRNQIARIANIPSPVLILGESGSGKEIVARELHSQSKRREGLFFAINCGALPSELVESELFGHERGAFTGADKVRKGAFQLASGGSIFLDEIGELPLQTQAVLLRVLEQKEIRRVGGNATITVDSRVIAATNRDLDEESRNGAFREDLYYRLNVHILHVPPLRDRRSDIPELTDFFVDSICRDYGLPPKTVSESATERLLAYDWHRNNVRELRNVVERMIIATDGDTIDADSVPPLQSSDSFPVSLDGTYQEQKIQAERYIVLNALAEHKWHITNTAEALGLSDHASLLKIMRRLNIERSGN
ncbi:MAG: sigma-54-dependent Fis family transcriptional regulator [Rhodothermales bacterium]|nr:sigma-54-dependent Fis family transcriptional regulator [Rhodothermales bacterium]